MKRLYIEPAIRVNKLTCFNQLLAGSPEKEIIEVGGEGAPDAKENSIFDIEGVLESE